MLCYPRILPFTEGHALIGGCNTLSIPRLIFLGSLEILRVDALYYRGEHLSKPDFRYPLGQPQVDAETLIGPFTLPSS
jgi:hypothetical protein